MVDKLFFALKLWPWIFYKSLALAIDNNTATSLQVPPHLFRRRSRTSEARGLYMYIGGQSVLEVAHPRFYLLEAILEGIHCSQVDDPLV